VKSYFVLNQYDGNININRETKDVLDELEIKTLKTTVKSRIAYVEAVVQGIGVYEYRDRKAKEEMTALTKEILDIITA
jgi:chromosome partitioning protein